MKYLLVLLTMLSLSAQAQETCSTVWVYKGYNTCAHSRHDLDLSSPGEEMGNIPDNESGWIGGGSNQGAECEKLVNAYNSRNKSAGLHATVIDSSEKTKKPGGVAIYNYSCLFKVKKYPHKKMASAHCGSAEKYGSKVGGEKPEIQGWITCLSCDQLKGASHQKRAGCLKFSLNEIIAKKEIEVRPTDLAAVGAEAGRLLEINKYRPIPGLDDSPETLELFIDAAKAK